MYSRMPRRLSAALATTAIAFSGLAALTGPANAAPSAAATCTGKLQMVDGDTQQTLGYLNWNGDAEQYRVATDSAQASSFRIGTGGGESLSDLSAPDGNSLVGGSLVGGTFDPGVMGYSILQRVADQQVLGGYVTWHLDSTSGAVTPTWHNPDGTARPTNLYGDMTKGDSTRSIEYVGLNSDRTAFENYWRFETAAPLTLEMVNPVCGAPQTITFGTDAPATAYVGRSYAATATSDSGNLVELTSTTPSVCEVPQGTFTVNFIAAGTCTIAADQGGDATHARATQVTQSITSQRIPATVTVLPEDLISGQATSLFAKVTLPDGSPEDLPAGAIQFAVDGDPLGAPVPVDTSYNAGHFARASSASFSPHAGNHPVTATFVPTDATTFAGSTSTGTLGAAKAVTGTTVAVTAQQLVATVAPQTAGTTAPSGSVLFRVAGVEVGRAAVVNGKATLAHAVAAGERNAVSAEYLGNDETLGSTDSVTRDDPFLSGEPTSTTPKSAAGWWRTPVRIDYTCTPNGAALIGDCPTADLVGSEGAGQSVTRTITALDGGLRSVTTTVDVDRTAPTVALKGVKSGQRVFATSPKTTCVASDALSGLDSCVITTTKGRNGARTMTATATDRAGNVATAKASYVVVRQAIVGSTYRNGAWEVRKGRGYTVQSVGGARPTYRIASATPGELVKAQTRPMTRTGKDTWAIGASMTMPRTADHTWYLGIQQGRSITPIKVRMVG